MRAAFAIMLLMNKEITRVAIVRLTALGDIVNSAIVLQFLRAAYPDAKIEWICEEVFAPLLLINKDLDKVHTLNIKKMKKERSYKQLKESIHKLKSLGPYDIIIDMQGLIKSAIVARLLGKNTHGFDVHSSRESLSSLFYKTSSNISYKSGVVTRNCFLVGDALKFQISDSMILNKKPIFNSTEEFIFQKKRKNIVFVIGASWNSKIYPKESVVKVCNALAEESYIIWGNDQERETAEWICQNSPYATLAPELNLAKLVAFISAADLLIGNDTGPTHLAWAQNIPSITLFGPTTTRMMYETPKNIGIESPSEVNILKIDKTDFSIKYISPKVVIHKAKELLYGL